MLAFGFLSTELTKRRPALEFYNQSPRLHWYSQQEWKRSGSEAYPLRAARARRGFSTRLGEGQASAIVGLWLDSL